MSIDFLKKEYFINAYEMNNELSEKFIMRVLVNLDKMYRDVQEDKFSCVLCNCQCSRTKKARHEKTNKHLNNVKKLSQKIAKKLNDTLFGDIDD